jgi:hypothetical protein
MPEFSLGVTFSNIANQEQSDPFFADNDPNAEVITQFPPVYSRVNWQITPEFTIRPTVDDEGVPETGDFELTRVIIVGSSHPIGDWNQLPKPPGAAGSNELILNVGEGTFIADNPRTTFDGQSSTFRFDITELLSPFNDSWGYLSSDFSNVEIEDTNDFPQANTYPGLFRWTEPTPDIYPVTYTFIAYGKIRNNFNEPYSQSFTVDQNLYFEYNPYISLIPQIVSQGQY